MRLFPLVLTAFALAACPDPAKDKTKAVVSAPTRPAQVALAPLANATRFPFSQANAKVGFVGAKVTGKHEGGFNTFAGVVEVVDGDLTKSRVQVDLEMASVFTDSDKLSQHLRDADFFLVEQFPTSRFVSSSFKGLEGARYEVTGDLTLRGVTKTIAFPAEVTVGAEQVDVKAEFAINRKDFGIAYPGKPDNLIADNVLLTLEVHAKKQ